MCKTLNFILIIFISTGIAGVYGIIHDQITYSISDEYYTLFKFEQFGINDWGINNVRVKAGVIGFLATWWVGFYLGLIYAIISLFFSSKEALKIVLKAVIINIGVAIVFGIIGFVYGILFLEAESLNWDIPEQTKNVRNFINVGSIHSFGYLGGLVGLLIGTYYQIKEMRKIVR